ncbi:hypothetical protein AAF712_006758 [Marasmius tenuissimus]|uniref:Uncharacterized protein n=1 Tax=Marasmius tenuissimus TaxID=585030 RepID=A0ABR2ZYH7_9AGAR
MSLLLARLSYRQLGPDSPAPPAPTPSSSDTRSTLGIIWSCLSMIILCAWTSAHPNVPSVPRSGHWALVFWDKATIFVVALLAPEIIVLWSARQWFAARKMAKEYKKYGWTMTHAFFALMGGFALYDSEGNFLFHLWDDRFCQHHKDQEGWDGFTKQQQKLGELQELLPDSRKSYSSLLEYCVANKMITMTKEEIKGLGHTDLVAKTITIFQTLHFITSCMGRGVDNLAITELEFFTFGFAALNLVSFSFWWHKPSGVRFPVRITHRKSTSPEQLDTQNKDEGSGHTDNTAMPSETRAPGICGAFSDRFRDDYYQQWDGCPLDKMLLIIRVPLAVVWGTLRNALTGDFHERPQPERGNIFSHGKVAPTKEILACSLMFATAVILGVFHCIPIMLNYHHFPSHTIDHHLWTVFALLITGLPLGSWIVFIFGIYCDVNSNVLDLIIYYSTFLLYPIARIALMVLAVKQLTDLPASALQQVEWTNLIPHFGG